MKTIFFLITALILGLLACKKENDGGSQNNTAPVANAGFTQAVSLPTDSVFLDGSASSAADGKIIEWHWSKISGPASFAIVNADSTKTVVKNLVRGSYVFELKVKSSSGLVAKNNIIVNVGHTPVARAGADTTLTIATCGKPIGETVVDGSNSSDDDNDISIYKWKQISGPTGLSFANASAAKTKITYSAAGLYVIELTVTDYFGLVASDTLKINVTTSLSDGYDLDLVVNGTVTFTNKEEICPWDCYYADVTDIPASGFISSLGNANIYISEEADTAIQSYNILSGYTVFRISNTLFAGGNSSFNFKKLIQQGGGSFNGFVQLSSGSAQACNVDVFKNLAPLTLTGSLDTTTHQVSMHIKGKIYF